MGKKFKKISVKVRIAVVFSAVWFTFFFFYAISDWSKDGPLGLMIAILPIMILWGIMWIMEGYKESKKLKDTPQVPVGWADSEKKRGD
jgi:hypothetical protein